MRGWLGASVLCVAVFAAHASAQSLPLELDWQAPQGCASRAQIEAELAQIARARPGRAIPRLTARGRIEPADGGYRLTLHTERDGKHGERTLLASECRALEREATLVLAIAFGEGVELLEPEPEPAPPSAREPQAEPAKAEPQRARTDAPPDDAPSGSAAGEASEAREPAQAETARVEPAADARAARADESELGDDASYDDESTPSSFHWALYAGGEGVLRLYPAAAGALQLGAELGLEHVWLEPRFSFAPGVDQELSRGVVASYSSFGAALAACAGAPVSIVRVSACLGFDVAALSAESTGATEPGEETAALYSTDALLAFAIPANGWLSVRVHARLALALHEPRFEIEGLGETHQVPRTSVAFGAALRFAPY